MKISLSIRDAIVEQLRLISKAAGVSDSSVAEVALKRLFAIGDQGAVVMTVLQEGATLRRHTRKTWLEAFYQALRDLVPAKLRTGASGYEFMGYDVMPTAERTSDPSRIIVHTMEANLPIGVATSYNGSMFSASLDSSPSETAKHVYAWLLAQPRVSELS